jgi:hypothetical protein
MAPKRPLPTGSASTHFTAGLLYQSTKEFSAAGAEVVSTAKQAAKSANKIRFRSSTLIVMVWTRMLMLQVRFAFGVEFTDFCGAQGAVKQLEFVEGSTQISD